MKGTPIDLRGIESIEPVPMDTSRIPCLDQLMELAGMIDGHFKERAEVIEIACRIAKIYHTPMFIAKITQEPY